MTPRAVVLIVTGFMFAAFVFQNAEVVQVHFLFWKAQASRALILLGTFVLGLAAGWISAWIREEKKKQS